MKMPSDPFMLLSMVNMRLRDGNYSDPEELCKEEDWDFKEMTSRLESAGFIYLPEVKQYR